MPSSPALNPGRPMAIYNAMIHPWAELQNAQLLTLRLPKTGMAVINDIGEAGNIHPRNKKDVGDRLARWALHDDYGRNTVVVSGPLFKEAKTEGANLVNGSGLPASLFRSDDWKLSTER